MSRLLNRKSKLSIENKLIPYKCIIKPIWTYGIQLWGCTNPSNTKIIQRFESKFLCLIINAPCYVSNFTLHNDLQIPFAIEEIHRLSTLYHQSVLEYNKRLVAENSEPPNARRRLRRQWPSDLPQLADEKSKSHHSPTTGLVRISSVDDFSTQDTYLE
jgi:carbonic anhydrase